jgi:type 2A phosphatase activator TIP41
MRLDNVLVRIRDTRIYVDFNTGKVIRDYIEKEETFPTVKNVRLPKHDLAPPS